MVDAADPARLKTGIPGLDTLLKGGFLRGGVYIVQGLPGSGKTILANQICFNHVAAGERAVYTTLLAESHARLLLHLKEMRFFDVGRIPDSLFYMSGFTDLEQHGLKGLLEVLRREVRARKATLLVLDGMVTVERTANDEQVFRRFIHDLQVNAHLVGCTVLLLNSSGLDNPRPEHTMVDGILDLSENPVDDRRTERTVTVKKFRGTAHLRGGHTFSISDDGITVHPRLESRYATPSTGPIASTKKLSTGLPHLDTIVGGGLREGSTTLIAGPSGAGKTILGMHFLGAASREEPALSFSFYENPAVLALKAHRLELGLEKLQRDGAFHCLWQPATENVLDAVGQRLIDGVRSTGARRVFVDGLDAFLKGANADRVSPFMTALTNELRALGATTVYTLEVPNLLGGGFRLPLAGVSTIVENLVVLRFVEVRTQLFRMLSVLKMRDSEHQTSLYEFSITKTGVTLHPTSESAELILAGLGRPPEGHP